MQDFIGTWFIGNSRVSRQSVEIVSPWIITLRCLEGCLDEARGQEINYRVVLKVGVMLGMGLRTDM